MATIQSGSFPSVGTGAPASFRYVANLTIWGTFSATVQLERSFDGGVTWVVVAADLYGTAAAWTSAVSMSINEPEGGVVYRLNCTSYTSGTVNWRISQ